MALFWIVAGFTREANLVETIVSKVTLKAYFSETLMLRKQKFANLLNRLRQTKCINFLSVATRWRPSTTIHIRHNMPIPKKPMISTLNLVGAVGFEPTTR